ncbi:MAG: UvrD-helicase domain-containing protein [Oscillospiraceae bacterium]|jgi:ATP-dependent helicase/nuclease subunit A
MADIKLTPNQELVVKSRGSALLVSAAAGSGKTRVLVERLMSYITDEENPRDIDTFLIITYTRAAAAELRSRILEELDKRLAADPGNKRLRRQSALCYGAQIGTIHSFCTRVIRENCHLLGIAPDFKVMEEDRSEEIKALVLEKLLEDAYEDIDRDEGFRLLVDTVGAGRDDSHLSEIILSLYKSMQSHAYPRDWAQKQIESMDLSHAADAGDTIWGKHLLGRAVSTADYWIRELDRLLGVIYSNEENAPLAKAYGESIAETADAVRGLCLSLREGKWDAAARHFPVPFPKLKSLRNFENEELKEYVKARRDACKKDMEKLEELFSDSSSQLIGDMEKTRPAMEALLRLALDFDAAYSREKWRLGLLDFSDLEHLAVRLLVDREKGAPTWLAVELSQKYTEIMIDEYQDVNAVQELIFKAVSNGGRNLFMVGDVKQSIYRFRLADPGIFIDKYLRYSDIETAPEGDSPESLIPPENPETGSSELLAPEEGRRILLQENFRSRASVLKAVNHVFRNIMSTELGELDYDDNAELKPGAQYPEGDCPVELNILALPEAEGEEESPHKTEIEAEYVARKIRELVDTGTMVYEKGVTRPLDYGDIVILLRSPNSSGQTFRRALAARGIPVLAEQGGDFFASLEISVMISLLAVIDNPHQDVPLISVLRSPLFGFTPDELALIRTCDRTGDFYTALKAASQDNPKCRAFLEKLQELREVAPDMSVDALIWHVYTQLDIIALTCAIKDGETGRENLMLLLEYARKFEENGYRGLFRFVAWLRRLAEKGEEPRVGAAKPGSAVRIMSIHKSKGLEFPVVFLSDTARRFNKNDLRRRVLVHPELGLGPKLTDADRGLEYPTLARKAIKYRLEIENLSEEMRILYVAMTRPKERLFITCALKDPQDLIGKLQESLGRPISPRVLERALSPAHWLIQAALLDEEGVIKLNIVNTGREAEETGKDAAASLPAGSGGDEPASETSEAAHRAYQELARQLDFVYPHASVVELPSKLTATEMKGRTIPAEMAEEAARLSVDEADFSFRRPDFVKKETPLTGVERGNATHSVMQYIEFSRTGSLEEIEEEISRLAALGHLTEKEARVVDRQAVLDFFRSELGSRVLKADRVLREFRFSILCPAEDFFETEPGEEVLLQGVVDCCIEEEGELTIIDYKTDYVNQSNINERIDLYSGQLRTYAMAMKRITGKPVRQAVIYFLQAGISAEVALS